MTTGTVTPLYPDTTRGGIVLDQARLASRLTALLHAGGLVLGCSRASADGGNAARELAVQGIYTAADALAKEGCDVSALLPDRADLETRLRTLAVVRRNISRDGKRFSNHSYLYTERVDQGLLLLVQYGTGVTLDADYQQPAVELVREAVTEFEPVLLYANEVRAWGRTGFPLAPLVAALHRVSDRLGEPVYLGDIEHAARPLSDEVETDLFTEGKRAQADARKIFIRTRDGMRKRTDAGQVSGLIRCGLSGTLPPPLATARLRRGADTDTEVGGDGLKRGPGIGDQYAFWDAPGCRPDPALVVYGLPEVYEPETLIPVDQVARVRWFYDHYRADGWSVTDVARYLAAKRFSTEALRRRRGPDATYLLRSGRLLGSDASHLCRAIWSHHEFHLTGRLLLPIGDGNVIEWQLQTPDGLPLARTDQVDRILEAEAEVRSLRPRRTVYAITGLAGTLNGSPVTLTPDFHAARDETRYVYAHAGPEAPRGRRRSPALPLPHRVLVTAIADALSDAGGRLLRPLLRDPDEATRLHAAVQSTQAALAEAEVALGAAGAHVRKPELHGRGLAFAQAAVDEADRALAQARLAHDRARAAARDVETPPDESGLPVGEVFGMLAAFRDPRNTEYRAWLRRAITDLTLSASTLPVADGAVRQLRFAFTLLLTDPAGQRWPVPIAGEHRVTMSPGRPGGAVSRVYEAIAAMHRGVPATDSLGAGHREWFPYLRAGLGLRPDAPCVLINVRDPRLVRLGAAVLHPLGPEPVQPPVVTAPEQMPTLVGPPLAARQRGALARRLEEPRPLLDRISTLYGNPPRDQGRWLRSPSPARVVALEDAQHGRLPNRKPLRSARCDGHLIFAPAPGGRLQVAACPHCGSRHRRLPLIWEMQGMVCTACRRDEAGNRWDADPYDQYLQ